MTFLAGILLVATQVSAPTETRFMQVAPWSREAERWERSNGRERAVVLISGLDVHVFKDGDVPKARFRAWQLPGSALVAALAHDGDVFAFAYGQNVSVEEVAGTAALRDGVQRLRALGYHEIVLLGHSAGGLVARQFVEDHPDAGVTKVVLVCTPNGGSSWSKLKSGVRPSQHAFVTSLSKEGRSEALRNRQGKQIPGGVQCVCVVGTGLVVGDGVVSLEAQWPADLREQGIPMVALRTDHFRVVRSNEHAKALADLVRGDHARWSIAEVEAAKTKLMGKKLSLSKH